MAVKDSFTFGDITRLVAEKVDEVFPNDSDGFPTAFVQNITSQDVIVDVTGKGLLQVPYSINQGEIILDPDAGTEVARTFAPIDTFTKDAQRGEYKIAISGWKETADGRRIIEGYASVFNVEDRDGEKMMPGAFTKGLDAFRASPVMLYMHGKDREVGVNPIGRYSVIEERSKGLWVVGELAQGDKHADRVWNLVQEGALNAFSVGGMFHANGRKEITRWDLVEISIVSVPANAFATFATVKGLSVLPVEVLDAGQLERQLTATKDLTDNTVTKAISDLRHAVAAISEMVTKGAEVDEATIETELRPALTFGAKTLSEGESDMGDEATVAAIEAALAKGFEALPAAMTAAMDARDTAAADAEKDAADKLEADKAIGLAAIKAYTDELKDKGFRVVGEGGQQLPIGGEAGEGGSGGTGDGNKALWDPTREPARVRTMHRYDSLETQDLAFLHETRKSLHYFFNPGQMWRPNEPLLRSLAVKSSKMYEAGELKFLDPTIFEKWVEPSDDEAGGGDWGGKELMAPWAVKADELMESDLAGFGLEWIPTLWTSQLWEQIRLTNAVVSFLQAGGGVFDMPSDPYTIPLEGSDPTVVLAPQATAATDFTFPGPAGISRVGTGNLTLTTKKLMAVIPFTRELEEDSILPVVPQLRGQTERAFENAVENVTINGDTTTGATSNINDIAGTPAGTENFLAADGLRHLGLITTTSDSLDIGTLTLNKIRAMRRLMGTGGKMGLRPSDLMAVSEGDTHYQLLGLDEVVTEDKFGPQATVRTGGLPSIDGIRIHASEEMVLSNADGKVDLDVGANNLFGQLVIWNRRQFRLGFRRRMNMVVERVPFADGGFLTASLRMTVQPRDTEGVAVGFHVLV